MIRMPTLIGHHMIIGIKMLITLLTPDRWWKSCDEIMINLLKLLHLVINKHFVGYVENFRVVGVFYQSCPQRFQHEHFAENMLMVCYKFRNGLDGDLVAYFGQTRLDDLA